MKEIEDVPRTYLQAITGKESRKWKEAIRDELGGLVGMGTWGVVPDPMDVNLVSTKWVFRKKINPDGTLRHKARLVARGFSQVEGEDYFKTFASTVSLNSVRIFTAHCAEEKMNIHNVDITLAYLYGKVDADVYLEKPEGLEQIMKDPLPPKPVCKLLKSLYWVKTEWVHLESDVG